MERISTDATTRRTAYDHRDWQTPSIGRRAGDRHNLVEPIGDEVHELHLDNRSHTIKRCADGRADNRSLTDWCINDALCTEFIEEALGDFERATVGSDVFTNHEHAIITTHFMSHCISNCFEVGHLHVLCAFLTIRST